MLLAVLFPFIISLATLLPLERYRETAGRLMVLLPLGLFIYFLSVYLVSGDQLFVYSSSSDLIPFSLDMKLDGLSWLFSLLITGIGTLIFLYAGGYMKGHRYGLRLFGFLSLFMGAMLGLVLSDNVLGVFTFWELTSISSFFLIGFNSDSSASRNSALKSLAVTGGGGLLLFAGLIGLGEISGTYSINEMGKVHSEIISNEFYPVVFVLVMLGAMSKSAQFPFHFWLPGAMKAPTPVSAYLHSATMVKAGVYLLGRLTPVMGHTELWNNSLMIVGGVTMVYAAFHSLLRRDLKGILAYSTVSALGIMFFLLGTGTEGAFLAVGLFVLVHALYKASLFMVTGIIDHETGSRDITELRGLRKVMLPVAIAGVLAAWSSAGIPPSLGFVGKDLIYGTTLTNLVHPHVITGIAVTTNIMLFAAGFFAGWKPFSGKLPERFEQVHLPEWTMWVPPLILALLGFIFGLLPVYIESPLLSSVYKSLTGGIWMDHLALWHGFNTVLLLSGITILLGSIVYLLIQPGGRISKGISSLEFLSPESIIDQFALRFNLFAKYLTKILQNGYLRIYVLVIILFTTGLLLYKMTWGMTFKQVDYMALSEVTIYEVITVIILISAILFTVFSTSRLVAVASMGVVGLTICLIFVYYSAPDLAMTQFTIDILTVILFVLVLYRLPRFIPLGFTWRHFRDATVALGFGIIMAILAIEVLQHVPNKEISSYYVDNAYVLAKGKNIVNVILVDFRGADTMIEIVVLAIAAIGVFGLLRLQIRNSQIEE